MTAPRILVKMPNWVGDCVMATPAINLLRNALPHATIDLLVRPGIAGILATNPHVSSVIPLHEKKLTPADLKRLRQPRYDATALFTNSLGSAWFAFKLRSRRRIGFNREGRGLLLTHRLPYRPLEWTTPTPQPVSRRSITGIPEKGHPRHMVEYYIEIARATLRAIDPALTDVTPGIDFKLVLPLHRAAEARISEMLRAAGLHNKTLIGINPGAAHGPAKRWSPERLGHLVDGLQRDDWAFVSTAAPNESHLNDRVQAATSAPIHRLGESTSLLELPALISRLSCLVTNDSGAMHIAAARQVPTITIFGPTDWASTHPWSAPAHRVSHSVPCSPCFLEECPLPDHPCMDGVEAYDVSRELLRALGVSGRFKKVTP